MVRNIQILSELKAVFWHFRFISFQCKEQIQRRFHFQILLRLEKFSIECLLGEKRVATSKKFESFWSFRQSLNVGITGRYVPAKFFGKKFVSIDSGGNKKTTKTATVKLKKFFLQL